MQWVQETPPQVVRYRCRTLLFASTLVAACYAIDLALRHGARAMAFRALWITALLLAAAVQRPGRPALAWWGAQFGSAATGLFVVVLVALTGGTASIYAGMLLVTPYAVLVGMVDLPVAALVSGMTCVAGGTWMRIAERQSPWQVASWLVLSGVMTALAGWGARASRRNWLAELAAERGRTRALEELAESERRRAEAERLAEVGLLAARVAHDVNNPLAVVKANVGWLGDECEHPDPTERLAVVEETLEGVERISRIVAELRSAAHLRPRGRPPGK